MVSEKKCSKCGEVKPTSEFTPDKAMRLGLKSNCKKCGAESAKRYRERNPEKVKESKKKYRSSEKGKAKEKEWENNNPEKRKEFKRRYRSSEKGKNTEKAYKNKYDKFRQETDDTYKCKETTRKTIGYCFRKMGYSKDSETCLILGKDWDGFKNDIQFQFDDHMSWDNYGNYWDYDHIIPIKYAMTPDEVIWLNYHTNFKPMERYENEVLKNDNIFYDLEALQRSLDAWGVKLNIE